MAYSPLSAPFATVSDIETVSFLPPGPSVIGNPRGESPTQKLRARRRERRRQSYAFAFSQSFASRASRARPWTCFEKRTHGRWLKSVRKRYAKHIICLQTSPENQRKQIHPSLEGAPVLRNPHLFTAARRSKLPNGQGEPVTRTLTRSSPRQLLTARRVSHTPHCI